MGRDDKALKTLFTVRPVIQRKNFLLPDRDTMQFVWLRDEILSCL